MKAPIKYCSVRTFMWTKSNIVPNSVTVGFQMAEKKLNRQTDKHFCIYNSRDKTFQAKLTYEVIKLSNLIIGKLY